MIMYFSIIEISTKSAGAYILSILYMIFIDKSVNFHSQSIKQFRSHI